jgi:hypothetical protein
MKMSVPKWWLAFTFLYKNTQTSAGWLLRSTHLTSWTVNRSKLYYGNLLVAVFSEPNISCSKSHIHFPLSKSFQRSVQIRDGMQHFETSWILRWGIFSPSPDPNAEGPPLLGCTILLIQYIRSYLPHLEAVSSICNPRTRHAVVTETRVIRQHKTPPCYMSP